MAAAAVGLFFISFLRCGFGSDKFQLHSVMNEPELMHYFQTTNAEKVPEYEILNLASASEVNPFGDEVEYEFTAFDRPINLKLKKNLDIVNPSFKTYIHDENGVRFFNETPSDCHYLHEEANLVAALSLCAPGAVQGLIFADNSSFEIQPLLPRLQRLTKRHAGGETAPHIIKRARFDSDFLFDEIFPIAGNAWNRQKAVESNKLEDFLDEEIFENSDYFLPRRGQSMTLELALFFDEAAFKIFAPFFSYDDKKLQNMLLAYINGVQALYHHPSLGTSLELVLVRLDIMKKQPRAMPHYNGERSQLLDSFCQYQADINPKDDKNPEHWDMGLYVSGLDFFAYENGKKSGVTMGLATVGGVCLDKYACVIAEFGTTNVFGKPYPSAGFTRYIMSPSRGTNGETQWSSCSAEVMAKLDWASCLKDAAKPVKGKDHSRFLDIPGRIYTAKRQCEVLLRDKDAVMSPNQPQADICFSLQCKTPHRSGFYFAGPALDGTPCGTAKYCYGGHCSSRQPPKPVKVTPGGWSVWRKGLCTSGCIQKAKGMQTSTRECNNPAPVNTDQGCEGVNSQFNFCRDDNICAGKRQSPVVYASKKCKEFSKLLPELDPKGAGLQAPHEDGRVWTSCAIFCKRRDSGAFYTPRIELNDLGNFQFTKKQIPTLDDVPFSQNARPNKPPIPPNLKNYFALSPNGRPIQTSFKNTDLYSTNEEEWETKDYVELPSIQKRFQALQQEVSDFDFF
ncbi:hypothetical protein HUJ05_012866 [Dendroctonus ponderosae]|nr:hypothetical protein HUJ05_012866 [Dendroctonus ponderosae]